MAKAPIPSTAPLQSHIKLKEKYRAAIALPSYNESSTLPDVLKSLCQNNAELIAQTLIIVNINNRLSADNSDNLETISFLDNFSSPLQLAWINSTEAPYAYDDKFGVGLARHQACSSTFPFLADHAPIISLDGDSPVNKDYLKNIYQHFQSGKAQAAHVNFQHQLVSGKEEELAIKLYDKHLYLHREGLLKAGSPHAWYAIGSTIVCTKAAYIKAGGYNCRRMAGEDFYLLQQLSKTGCTIDIIDGAWVYPSNRQSSRVPFGTGKAVNEIVEAGTWQTYAPECYAYLKILLDTIKKSLSRNADCIIEQLPKDISSYLDERKFRDNWPKLQANSKTNEMLLRRFHEWLDAFQTLKLIHHLTESKFPKVAVEL
jgi:hypothetical protein